MMLRRLTILLLAAVLAMTSVTLALARHADVGGTTITLCSDAGERLITLDAQGNPMPAAHPCPDCVAAIAAQDIPPALALPLPPLAQHRLKMPHLARHARGQTPPPASARGPPLWLMSV